MGQSVEVDDVCRQGDETQGLSLLALRGIPTFGQKYDDSSAYHRSDATDSADVAQMSSPERSFSSLLAEDNIEESLRHAFHATADGRQVIHDTEDGRQDRWFEEWRGKNAPLDEEGYDAVSALEADEEMEIFIRRLIKAMDYKIIDMGGLHGVVPYYSGTKVSQSFTNLLRDLKRGLKRHGKYGPWLEKK